MKTKIIIYGLLLGSVFLLFKNIFLYKYFGFDDFLIYYVVVPLSILIIAGLHLRFSERYISIGHILKAFFGILIMGVIIDFFGTVYLSTTLSKIEKHEITLLQGMIEPPTNFFNNINLYDYKTLDVHFLLSIKKVIPLLIFTFLLSFICSILPAFLIRKEQT